MEFSFSNYRRTLWVNIWKKYTNRYYWYLSHGEWKCWTGVKRTPPGDHLGNFHSCPVNHCIFSSKWCLKIINDHMKNKLHSCHWFVSCSKWKYQGVLLTSHPRQSRWKVSRPPCKSCHLKNNYGWKWVENSYLKIVILSLIFITWRMVKMCI